MQIIAGCTWQCDNGNCERETSIRHERYSGVFCERCAQNRVLVSYDPEMERREQVQVSDHQRSIVEQYKV